MKDEETFIGDVILSFAVVGGDVDIRRILTYHYYPLAV